MRVDSARTAYEIDGAGVTIGVLSDSYDFDGNPFSSAALDILTRDLPAHGVQVLDESDSQGIDEGRAMLELIHDLAPGSPLQFHTVDGPADAFRSVAIREKSFLAGVVPATRPVFLEFPVPDAAPDRTAMRP